MTEPNNAYTPVPLCIIIRSEEHTSELQSQSNLVCRLLLEKKNTVRYLTGLEAERVYAEYGTFDQPVEVEEYLVGSIRYRGGAIGQIEVGSCIRGCEEAASP